AHRLLAAERVRERAAQPGREVLRFFDGRRHLAEQAGPARAADRAQDLVLDLVDPDDLLDGEVLEQPQVLGVLLRHDHQRLERQPLPQRRELCEQRRLAQPRQHRDRADRAGRGALERLPTVRRDDVRAPVQRGAQPLQQRGLTTIDCQRALPEELLCGRHRGEGTARAGHAVIHDRRQSFLAVSSGPQRNRRWAGRVRPRGYNTERATAAAGGSGVAGAGASRPDVALDIVVLHRLTSWRREAGGAACGACGGGRRGGPPGRRLAQCGVDGPLFSRRGGCARAALLGIRRGAVLHELELVEARVEAAALEELAVRPLLAQLAPVEDEDAVGVLDGGEAVGDDDGGAAAHEGVERVLDLALERGVDGAGGLVEDEDERVEGEGACEGEELALADGEGDAALADGLSVAVGEPLDEAVGADAGGGRADAGLVDV